MHSDLPYDCYLICVHDVISWFFHY